MATTTKATARKQPQDHRAKGAVLADDDEGQQDSLGPVRGELDGDVWRFTTDDGETWHESNPLSEVFTPRWARLNRRRADLDAIYTAVEDAYDGNDDALDAWDALSFTEQANLGNSLFTAMGASLGMNQLLDMHEEHPLEFEHELIQLGLRWRDFPNPNLSWRDLAVIVACLDDSSRLRLAVNPESTVSIEAHMLRSMEHSLRWTVWSKSTESQSGRPPQPWRFAWEEDTDAGYRADPMTADEVNDFLGWADMIARENTRRAEQGLPPIPT